MFSVLLDYLSRMMNQLLMNVSFCCSYLELPDSIEDYFAWAYAAGARIHSNSWGHSANTYDDYPRSIDDFVASQAPDMLILFAAANQGHQRTFFCMKPHHYHDYLKYQVLFLRIWKQR
jgi:hypothetical protein